MSREQERIAKKLYGFVDNNSLYDSKLKMVPKISTKMIYKKDSSTLDSPKI